MTRVENIEIVYDILSIILSINIIFWFTWAMRYNIKRILFYKKTRQSIFFTTYFNLVVSFMFAIIFCYIIAMTIMNKNVIDNASFGALIIRPVILLEAVGTAINEMRKFKMGGCE